MDAVGSGAAGSLWHLRRGADEPCYSPPPIPSGRAPWCFTAARHAIDADPEVLPQHLEIIDRTWGTGGIHSSASWRRRAPSTKQRTHQPRNERQGASPSASARSCGVNAEMMPGVFRPSHADAGAHRGGRRSRHHRRRTIHRQLTCRVRNWCRLPANNTFSGTSATRTDRRPSRDEESSRLPRRERADRVLTTVLVTTSVDSTKCARGRPADRSMWIQCPVDRHDEIVALQIGGLRREVKHTGDGFLATFDGRRGRCGCASGDRRHDAPMGLAVRAGCDTGEIRAEEGHDIGGGSRSTLPRASPAMAGPNETLVSSTVRDLVAGSGLRLRGPRPSRA